MTNPAQIPMQALDYRIKKAELAAALCTNESLDFADTVAQAETLLGMCGIYEQEIEPIGVLEGYDRPATNRL